MPIDRINKPLVERDFEDAIKWTEPRTKHGESPVFRITNRKDEILESLELKRIIEDYLYDYSDILQPGVVNVLNGFLKDCKQK